MQNRPVTQERISFMANVRRMAILGFFNAINTIAFFSTMLIKDTTESIWSNSVVKYFNAPMAIVISLFRTILVWKQVHLSKGKDKLLVWDAIITTLGAGAMMAAAIGVVASIAAFAFVAPILITAASALRSIYNLGAALYLAIKAAITENVEHKTHYKANAKKALASAVTSTVFTGLMVTLMLVAAPVAQTVIASILLASAVLGVITSLIGIASISKQLKEMNNPAPEGEPGPDPDNNAYLTNNASVAQRLGVDTAPATEVEPAEDRLLTTATESAQPTTAEENTVQNEDLPDHEAPVAAHKI